MSALGQKQAAFATSPSGHRLGLASLTNGTVPPLLPITAPFFFESETAGLMLVWHRSPQGFRWSLFSWFPRENAASDYKRGHGHKEHRKL